MTKKSEKIADKFKAEVQRDIDGFSMADCYADEVFLHDKDIGRYHFYPLGPNVSTIIYTVFLYSVDACVKLLPLVNGKDRQLDVRGIEFDRIEFSTGGDPDGHIHLFAYPVNYGDRYDPVDPTPVEVPIDDAPETMEQMIARMVGERIAMERGSDGETETFQEANDFGDDDDDDDVGYVTEYTELEEDDISDLPGDPPKDAEQPDPAQPDPAVTGPAPEQTNAPGHPATAEPESGPDTTPATHHHPGDPHADPQATTGSAR